MNRLAVVALFSTVVFVAGCGVPDNVDVVRDFPSDVVVGEEFTFTVTVMNRDARVHELRSVDVGDDFLEGIVILGTSLPVREEYDAFGWHVYEFKKDLAGQSETSVVFTAKARVAGDFSGDLDVCIDGDGSCLLGSIRIAAHEPDTE